MESTGLKKIGFLFMFAFLLVFFWNQNSAVAKAATPAFQKKEVEVSGVGEVYQLKILHKVSNSKYQWSSSDKTIVKVSNTGLLTTVDKGTVTVKCKITYPSGKVKNLYCKVTVIIPATAIEIDKAKESNGAYLMRVGETVTFSRTLTPENSTDKTFWSIDTSDSESNPNAIRIDNSANGTVTALRRGKIVLVATAAKEATAKSAAVSEVKDAVIIEVVGSAAEVVSAEFISSQKIKVVFGTAIKESTVVNSNGSLSNNITVARLDDSTGNTAKDPGALTAILSSSQKTLTITAANSFDGRYSITFSNSILTAEGTAIYKDYMELTYEGVTSEDDTDDTYNDTDDDTDTDTDDTQVDTNAPKLVSTELNDTGMINVITFSEKMDFSNFQVNDAKAVSTSSDYQSSTISYLNSEANYSFSSDGKSVLLDLTSIYSGDYNKYFTVAISGITDAAGNRLENDSVIVAVHTDTAPRAQARPISVVRSSYDTITVTFDRSIRTPGFMNINYSGSYPGYVDLDNSRKVNYRMSSYDSTLTGTQKVSIGYWNSYNVISTDTYASQMHDFQVYFTTETVRPYCISNSFNQDLNILTLTFNENVHLMSDTGIIQYTMASYKGEVITGYFNYTKASTVGNVIEIMLNNITLYGDYSFTLPEGFIWDDYHNQSYSKTMTIYKSNGEVDTNKLAEPYSISQSSANHSLIYIDFADKLDPTTATDANNYSISGATIEEIKLIKNTSDGAEVRLTLGKGTIKATADYKISISGLKGYNGSSSQMADYSTQIRLIENIVPELKSVKYDAASKNTIILTFTEQIKGTMLVTVRERATGYVIGSTVTVSGDTVNITLTSIPSDGTYLQIYVENNSITDQSDNESTISAVLDAFANY